MSENIWSDRAAEYKRDGEMYASVEYDHNGDPARINVARNQLRKGEFNVVGGTAVYDEPDTLNRARPGQAVVEYVRNLPFVQAVDMGETDE